ncbi:hypothetical protein A9G15_04020 [Gilliamella apis]|uniref:hypothetical protein n=1 Tax=Gilliamella apis TaxID=1970738 RepID=UPI00080E9FD8|nr:hypothetical protein [Gilliamella apis]OCG04274.1 hypothetical protein A9G15_04020 [Gilliamella apis]
MASDHKQINFNQYYEIRDWLIKNNYSGSESNQKYLRDNLAPKIKKYFKKDSSQHLTWGELDEYHKDFPSDFEDLEN